MQCQKLTINIGEVEMFIEVYDKQQTPEEDIKMGDTTWFLKDDVLQQHTWFGPEEKWVAQNFDTTVVSNINSVAQSMSGKSAEDIIVRILNSDPEFDKENYDSEGGEVCQV